MPLFDYECPSCRRTFEQLVRGPEAVGCPSCGETKVKKLLSVPARPASASAAPAPACGDVGPMGGCCGGGACGLN